MAKAQQPTKESPIGVMHQRWEQTWIEYAAVEKAEAQAHPRDATPNAYTAAMRTLSREADALTNAILYQVPDSWVDAMILHLHILNAYDLMSSDESAKTIEWERLETALETVFDFMACEIACDHADIGPSFITTAGILFNRRRLRTGVVED